MLNTQSLVSSIRANCGITYDVRTGDFPTMGFAVSIPGHEKRLEYLTAESLQRYLDEHAHALAQPGNYLGAWFTGDEWCLDVSRIVDDESTAEQLGAAWGQEAIFNLETKEATFVPTWRRFEDATIPTDSFAN